MKIMETVLMIIGLLASLLMLAISLGNALKWIKQENNYNNAIFEEEDIVRVLKERKKLEADCKKAVLDKNSDFNKWLTNALDKKPYLRELKITILYQIYLNENKL